MNKIQVLESTESYKTPIGGEPQRGHKRKMDKFVFFLGALRLTGAVARSAAVSGFTPAPPALTHRLKSSRVTSTLVSSKGTQDWLLPRATGVAKNANDDRQAPVAALRCIIGGSQEAKERDSGPNNEEVMLWLERSTVSGGWRHGPWA